MPAGLMFRRPKTTMRLTVGGMTCDECARRVKEALEAVRDVQAADVQLATGLANVVVKDGADREELVAAVRAAGYKAEEAP